MQARRVFGDRAHLLVGHLARNLHHDAAVHVLSVLVHAALARLESLELCDGVVGKTRLNLALTDSRRSLENPIAERLFEKLGQMESLQADVNRAAGDSLPIAWERTELIATALTARLIHSIEHDSGNDQFQSLSNRATEAVGHA